MVGTAQVRLCLPYDFASALFAALSRHFRHKHSSPSTGIGMRTDSSMHQQAPVGSQTKSAPHREQANRRNRGISFAGISVGFVMKLKEFRPDFHVRFISNGSIICRACRDVFGKNLPPKENTPERS